MPDFSSLREQTTKEDAFAHRILEPDALRPAIDRAGARAGATTTQAMKTQTETDEWQTLCRARGWHCRICKLYPEHGNPLGYEDGLCPAHRLTSHAE
jgi:hypothetical protein